MEVAGPVPPAGPGCLPALCPGSLGHLWPWGARGAEGRPRTSPTTEPRKTASCPGWAGGTGSAGASPAPHASVPRSVSHRNSWTSGPFPLRPRDDGGGHPRPQSRAPSDVPFPRLSLRDGQRLAQGRTAGQQSPGPRPCGWRSRGGTESMETQVAAPCSPGGRHGGRRPEQRC